VRRPIAREKQSHSEPGRSATIQEYRNRRLAGSTRGRAGRPAGRSAAPRDRAAAAGRRCAVQLGAGPEMLAPRRPTATGSSRAAPAARVPSSPGSSAATPTSRWTGPSARTRRRRVGARAGPCGPRTLRLRRRCPQQGHPPPQRRPAPRAREGALATQPPDAGSGRKRGSFVSTCVVLTIRMHMSYVLVMSDGGSAWHSRT